MKNLPKKHRSEPKAMPSGQVVSRSLDQVVGRKIRSGYDLWRYARSQGITAVAWALRAYVERGQPEDWCKGYTTRAMCRIASNGVENIRDSDGTPSYMETRWGCELYAFMWGASGTPPNAAPHGRRSRTVQPLVGASGQEE
jgi:hypothetical protein